jgi:hypothetical protein
MIKTGDYVSIVKLTNGKYQLTWDNNGYICWDPHDYDCFEELQIRCDIIGAIVIPYEDLRHRILSNKVHRLF